MSQELDALQTLRNAALEWARADRTADDLAAKLQRAESDLYMFMISRPHDKVTAQRQPEHARLVWSQDAAAAAFKDACVREHDADEALKELARAMLSDEERANAPTEADDG